jgi:hypothetical protein
VVLTRIPTTAALTSGKTRSPHTPFALAWYITQDARRAHGLVAGDQNPHEQQRALQSGWSGSSWPRATEIIRYTYTGWSSTEVSRFATMLRTVYLPKIINGSNSNGNWELGTGNWELSMMDAAVGTRSS